jgi:hypothetical protein
MPLRAITSGASSMMAGRHAPQQPLQDVAPVLRRDGQVALRAVLGAELDVQQAQEVMHLGQRADGALAPAAAGALLDGDRRRDAEDRVHIGPRRRLHELARIGVQRLQIAPLPLGEQDVEGQRALAAAGDAGDDDEAIPRDRQGEVLEVVLAGVADLDARSSGRGLRRRSADRARASATDAVGDASLGGPRRCRRQGSLAMRPIARPQGRPVWLSGCSATSNPVCRSRPARRRRRRPPAPGR